MASQTPTRPRTPTVEEESRSELPYAAGIGPGLLGGLAMLVVLLIAGLTRFDGPLADVYLIASTFAGPRAMLGGAGPFLLGLLTHAAMSVLLGMLFAGLLGRVRRRRAVLAGLLFAAVFWALMTFGVIPLINPFMAERMEAGPFLLAHLAYGITLGATVPSLAASQAGVLPRGVTPWRRTVRP